MRNVGRLNSGRRRRLSMPSSRSLSRRPSPLLTIQLDNGAKRLPHSAAVRALTERAGVERRAVPLPVVGEELALEAGDVNANRALRLARSTLETQIERVVDRLVAEPCLAEPAGHRQAQDVRAPARGVLFVARRHVRRTHRAFERLATCAEPAAHLHGAGEAALRDIQRRWAPCASSTWRPKRKLAVRGGASTILPGLKMPCGSNVRLIVRNAS